MSLEAGKTTWVGSIMGVGGGRPEQASGEKGQIHRGREWDETKRSAWIQTLGNRQEEESLTRQSQGVSI